MAEAIADALILYYQRKQAMDHAYQDWFNTTEWTHVKGKLVPVNPSDKAKFEGFKRRFEQLEQGKPSPGDVSK